MSKKGKNKNAKQEKVDEVNADSVKPAGDGSSGTKNARKLTDEGVIPRPRAGETMESYVSTELSKYVNEDGTPVVFKDVLANARIVEALKDDENFNRLKSEYESSNEVPSAEEGTKAQEGTNVKPKEVVVDTASDAFAAPGNREESSGNVVDDNANADVYGASEEERDKKTAASKILASDFNVVDFDLMKEIKYTTDDRAVSMYDLGLGVDDLTDGGSFAYDYDGQYAYDGVSRIVRPARIKASLEVNADICTVQLVSADERFDAIRRMTHLNNPNGAYALTVGPTAAAQSLTHTRTALGTVHTVRLPKGRLDYLIRSRDAAMHLYYLPRLAAFGNALFPARNNNAYLHPFAQYVTAVYHPKVHDNLIKRALPAANRFDYTLAMMPRPTMLARPNAVSNLFDPVARAALDIEVGASMRADSYKKAYDTLQEKFSPSDKSGMILNQRDAMYSRYFGQLSQSSAYTYAISTTAVYTGGARHMFSVGRVSNPTPFDGVLAYAMLRMTDTEFIDSVSLRYLYTLALRSVGYDEIAAAREVDGFTGNVILYNARADPLSNIQAFDLRQPFDNVNQRNQIQNLLNATTRRTSRMSHSDRLFTGPLNQINGVDVPRNTLGDGWTPLLRFELDGGRTLRTLLDIIYGRVDGSTEYLINNIVSNDMAAIYADVFAWLTISTRVHSTHAQKDGNTFLAAFGRLRNQLLAHAVQGCSALVYAQKMIFDDAMCIPPLTTQAFLRDPQHYTTVELDLSGALSLLIYGITPAEGLTRYDGFGSVPQFETFSLKLQYEGCISEYVLRYAFSNNAPNGFKISLASTMHTDESCDLITMMTDIFSRIFKSADEGTRARFIEYRKRFATGARLVQVQGVIQVQNVNAAVVAARACHTQLEFEMFTRMWVSDPPPFRRMMERETVVTYVDAIVPTRIRATSFTHGYPEDHYIEVYQNDDTPKRFLTEQEGHMLVNLSDNGAVRTAFLQGLRDEQYAILMPLTSLREIRSMRIESFAFRQLPDLSLKEKIEGVRSLRTHIRRRNNIDINLVGCWVSDLGKTYATVEPKLLTEDKFTPTENIDAKTVFKSKRGVTSMQVAKVPLYYRVVLQNESISDIFTSVHTVPYSARLDSWLLHIGADENDVRLFRGDLDLMDRQGVRLYDLDTKIYQREGEDIHLGVDQFIRDTLPVRPASDAS
jgi:hypothetical protein